MIKIFEEYNQYYTEIDTNEFYNLSDYKTLIFSGDEISIIKKEIEVDIDLSYNVQRIGEKYIFYKELTGTTFIFKTPDEWYLCNKVLLERVSLKFDITYYKCDQLDGLIKCLKDDKDI